MTRQRPGGEGRHALKSSRLPEFCQQSSEWNCMKMLVAKSWVLQEGLESDVLGKGHMELLEEAIERVCLPRGSRRTDFLQQTSASPRCGLAVKRCGPLRIVGREMQSAQLPQPCTGGRRSGTLHQHVPAILSCGEVEHPRRSRHTTTFAHSKKLKLTDRCSPRSTNRQP